MKDNKNKPLFGDLIAARDGLADDLKSVDMAADLTVLLASEVLVRQVARKAVMCNLERQEEARWASRAHELVALFDHNDLPSTSGKFGD